MLRKRHNTNESPGALLHLAALIFLLSGLLVACGGNNSRTQGTADDDSTILRVGVLPTHECLRLYYACRMGATDSLGLRLVSFGSIADIDTALLGGSIDVALTDTARLNYLCSRYDTAKAFSILAAAHDTLWLVATDSSKVRGAGGMKDKLIGMLRYSDAQTAANRLTEHARYQEGEVFFIQLANPTLRYKMLTARLLDAAFLPHPYSDAAIALGHRRIKLPVTDTLCQGVWVMRHGVQDTSRLSVLRGLLSDTTVMQPDTVRAILQDIYLLPQQHLDSLESYNSKQNITSDGNTKH